MSALDLRRAALEALGWTFVEMPDSYMGHVPRCRNTGKPGPIAGCCCDLIQHCPAIEFDPGVSEPLFLEWCGQHGYRWDMRSHVRPSDDLQSQVMGASMRIYRRGKWLYGVTGKNPSECRAKAIAQGAKK